jgi:hypothetical protein
MNRMELERLDREALIARAAEAGVTRAGILTRSELVDELLLRSAADEATKARTRGFFGRARDLLARAVERGLHLPDAADRIRTLGAAPAQRRAAPVALPTVTLAEIYAAQGHRDRAIETLDGVLTREPDHAAARSLLTQLKDASYPVPQPRLPPEPESVWPPVESDSENFSVMPSSHTARPVPLDDKPPEGQAIDAAREPAHLLDDAPLPPRYDVDECVAIPVDPRTLYVYWEVRERTLEYIGIARPDGTIVLRVLVVEPTWEGPRSIVRDHQVGATLGDLFVRDLSPGCVVRTAIGWKHGDVFMPIAHSPALEAPPGAPSPLLADVLVRWTPSGIAPVSPDDRDAAAIDRALGRARREATRLWQGREAVPEEGPPGSHEMWVNAPSS